MSMFLPIQHFITPSSKLPSNIQVQKTFKGSTKPGFRPFGPIRFKCFAALRDSSTMSHGVTRRRESPEKEAARKEKEKGQIVEYEALVQDVLTHVFPPSKPSTLKLSATQMTFPRKPSI
jgi:hypothetical protein